MPRTPTAAELADMMETDLPPLKWMHMPLKFTLVCERRGDGGLRLHCPEVPGLILSHANPEEVLRDVIPAIDALERHNRTKK